MKRYNKLFSDSLEALRSLKGRFNGQRVFVVGCAPSLTTQPLGALVDCPVICVNWAHLALESVSPSWSCSVVTDDYRIGELRGKLIAKDRKVVCSPCKWTVDPELYSDPFLCLRPKTKSSGRIDFGIGCSLDLEEGVYLGRSVIFTAIQIAAYLGAAEIVCLGMDMDYSGARTYFDNRISSGNWSGFRYHKHGKPMLAHMREVLKESGVELLNGTNGGAVDCLQKVKI